MTLKDIKIGQNIKDARKNTFDSDNVIIERFPSFCNSKYLSARDLDNGKEIFLKVENEIIVDITENISNTYNKQQAEKTLDFILSNY
jgi:hypothetical protein